MNDKSTEKLDDLMDRYLFGLLGSFQLNRVRRRIESDPEWQLAYEAAVERKRILTRGVYAGKSRGGASERTFSRRIVSVARAREARETGKWRLARGVFGGLAAAAAIVIAVSWIRVATITPPTHTIRLLGQTQLMAGSVASLRTFVSDIAGNLVGDAPVRIVLKNPQIGLSVVLADWVTDASGIASGQVNVPDWPDADYTLVATTTKGKAAVIEVPITIKRARKVYLSTDKPIYQPGQTIHMRCLVLRKPSLRPDAGGEAEFSVTDPAGNVIFREPVDLSEFGIASTDLPLDELINTGRYTVKITAAGDASEQTVEIFRYKLPAFSVKVTLDKPYYLAGQTITGGVDVQYHFGKPVAGASVALELTERYISRAGSLRKLDVTTDTEGKGRFRIDLPRTLFGSRMTSGDARLLLSARATDTAGQENVGYRTVVVARQDIRIAAAAENGLNHSRTESRLFIVTSYPDGRPAGTVVDIDSLAQSVRTNDAGVAVLFVRNVPDPCRISARDSAGRTGSVEISLPQSAGRAFVLRTDRPVYSAGETISVEIIAARAGEVFLDVIKDRQTVLTKALDITAGRATLALDLPAELAGTLRLHAYRLDDEGEWVGRDVLIVVRPSRQLNVKVSRDREVYRPGDDAKLTFRVTDTAGKGVPAALSLSAVDEAVYSVQQAAPGLEKTLAGLDTELLTPAVQTNNFSLGLIGSDRDYAEAVLASAVTISPPKHSRLKELEDEGYLPRDMLRRWNPAQIRRALKQQPWVSEQLGPELIAELTGGSAGAGPHTMDSDNKHEAMAAYRSRKDDAKETAEGLSLASLVLGLISVLLLAICWYASSPERSDSVGSIALWILLVVAILAVIASILLPTLGSAKYLAKQAILGSEIRALGMAEAMASAESMPPEATAQDLPKSGQVRVRTYFPETMLWRPEVITDGRGRADLTVPLADSITTWRLAGSAVSKAGQLGSVRSSIRVFQPFFVDIDAPGSLTAGDEVSVPLVLYNYTLGELKVSLRAESSAGLTILQNTEQEIALTPGQVKRAYVRLRADSIGEATLTIKASGGNVADAIRRPIRVVPPGLPQSFSINGTLRDGDQFVDLTIPADAVPGSVAVSMKVYPSTFSELLDGLDGILQKPYGCFEQTTSATYPNIMALTYMKSQGIGKPEILAKARRYVHLGYQRLLSFEVSGGGFSLFGAAPANLPLTSYGLMEFVDMAKVHNVDPAVLSRTVQWLAGRQSADGSWRGHLPIMGQEITVNRGDLASTAYVTWATAMSDPRSESARRGAEYVARHIGLAEDPHTLALCVNALLTVDSQNAAGLAGARRLDRMANKRGADQCYWSARSAPLAYCRGAFGDVETTSLAALALTKARRNTPLVHDALRWIASKRDARGTWGTTQPTVLALKALLAGSTTPARRDKDATVSVAVVDSGRADGLGEVTIRPDQFDVVKTLRLDGLKQPGRYRLRLVGRASVGMAYQLVVRYHSEAAAKVRPAGSALTISVEYDRTRLETGGTVKVRATIANNANEPAGMPLADIGTPPGFVVRPAGLDSLQAKGKIERYTITARGVIVYLNTLQPRKSISIDYEMVARMPLRAVAAPTTLYPYYEPERQTAARPVMFVVE